MAYSVYYVARAIALNLTRPDLGHPNLPNLWDEIYPASKLPPSQLQCLQCLEERGPTCPEFMYLRVRDGRREAVHHNTNVRAHATGESDAHRALKERTANVATDAGWTVDVEDRATHGRRRTDVLIHGASGVRLGVEAQLSYIGASGVRTRTATATADGITSMWVVNHERAEPINRAPWCLVPDADWRTYLKPGLKTLGGVRHLTWESCDDLTRRGVACPIRKRRSSCGRWHSAWDPRQVPYDDLVMRAAEQDLVPIEILNGNSKLYYWVPAQHRATFVAQEAEQAEEAIRPARQQKPRPLDPTCTYGQDSGYRSQPVPSRDTSRAIATLDRSVRRGRGLEGPPCRERADLDQHTPKGMWPREAMCIRCGRVTARRNPQGLAWCGGELPVPSEEGR